MDYEEHKRRRKEFSKKKKQMEDKVTDKLLQKHPNLLKAIDDGTITKKEAIKLAKGMMNSVSSVKLKGDGWVEGNENDEIQKKLKSETEKINIADLITDFENTTQTINNFEIIQSPIDEIKPHPYNYEIYEPFDKEDSEVRNEFVESIRRYGILEPIVVNPNNEIISGHRRYFGSKECGLDIVPIRRVEFDNDIVAIIHFNKQREKNKKIFRREFEELDKNLYKKLGGKGFANKGGLNVIHHIMERLSVSRGSATKIYKISQINPQLLEELKLPTNPKGTLSVDKAYKMVTAKKSDSKSSTKPNPLVPLKKNLSKITTDELVGLIETTYPFSLMASSTKGKFTSITFDKSKLKKLSAKRDELIRNLEFKKSLSMRELLMFEKYDETDRTDISEEIKRKAYESLWKPSDINDEKKTIKEIESLEPILVEPPKDKSLFNAIRIYTHSLAWNPNPGRNMKYMVVDKHTNKILGLIVMGSDIMHIDVRDKKIGWSNTMKISQKKLNHTAIATTLVPTSVLGYNFLGTKLIAGISITEDIQKSYKDRYGDVLVGVTTTSLFGTKSSYNGIPNIKKLGRTKGKVVLNPSKDIYQFWLKWLKDNHINDYNDSLYSDSGNVNTGPKQNVMRAIFGYLDIKSSDYYHLNEKGVYFSELYHNSKDFLNGEIGEYELKKKSLTIEKLMKWWKPKAINRYKKLKAENRLDSDFYWYDEMNEDEIRSWLVNRGKSLEDIFED